MHDRLNQGTLKRTQEMPERHMLAGEGVLKRFGPDPFDLFFFPTFGIMTCVLKVLVLILPAVGASESYGCNKRNVNLMLY